MNAVEGRAAAVDVVVDVAALVSVVVVESVCVAVAVVGATIAGNLLEINRVRKNNSKKPAFGRPRP